MILENASDKQKIFIKNENTFIDQFMKINITMVLRSNLFILSFHNACMHDTSCSCLNIFFYKNLCVDEMLKHLNTKILKKKNNI